MPKLYLLGGENVSKRSAKAVNELAFVDAGGRPNILVVPWANPSFDKAYGKRKLLEDYFRSMGAERVEFADYDETDLAQKIAEANLVYLTGGQASILIERAKKMHLEIHLKNYQGIIVCRSAGALALCSHCITTRRYSKRVATVNGLGLANLTLKAHFVAADEEKLKQFSLTRPVYAVSKDCALIVEDGKLGAIGEVYLFNGGVRHLFMQGCLRDESAHIDF
jgi:dipeptidase E